MISIIQNKINKPKFKKNLLNTIVILLWVVAWQLLSMAIGAELLLASPINTIKTLFNLLGQTAFWCCILNSFIKITLGFFVGVSAGYILAFISYRCKAIGILFSPLISVVKTIPVASFIILALVWVNAANLSTLISFLMVFPVVYINIFQSLNDIDKKTLQMVKIFKITPVKRFTQIYIPSTLNSFIASCKISLGLAWKSGVAAEVIGISANTLGEQLYQAKIFLSTAEVLAVTLVIVIISALFEKIFILLLNLIKRKIYKGL